MKYDLYTYIEGIESEIKSDSRSFFKFANMKRNSSGYPSSILFESQSVRGPEEIELVSVLTLDTLPDEDHESHKVSYPAHADSS
jgi:hypothetical protein